MNDAQSTRVRRALSLVSKELAGLTAAPHTQLDLVFGALVTELDLGPEPQRRTWFGRAAAAVEAGLEAVTSTIATAVAPVARAIAAVGLGNGKGKANTENIEITNS